MNVCKLDGCDKPVRVEKRGLCKNHYQVWARTNKPRKNGKECSLPDCGKQHYAKGMCQSHYNNNERCGNPYGMRAAFAATEPVYCEKHPTQQLNSKGSCQSCKSNEYYWEGPKGGVRHDLRRADIPTYETMHLRIRVERGRAAEWDCVDCEEKTPAFAWSLKHDAPGKMQVPSGRSIGMLYSLNVWDYEPRCDMHHRAYDAKYDNRRERRPNGTYFRDQRQQWLNRKARLANA